MTETPYRQAFKRNPEISSQFPIDFDKITIRIEDDNKEFIDATRSLKEYNFPQLGFRFAIGSRVQSGVFLIVTDELYQLQLSGKLPVYEPSAADLAKRVKLARLESAQNVYDEVSPLVFQWMEEMADARSVTYTIKESDELNKHGWIDCDHIREKFRTEMEKRGYSFDYHRNREGSYIQIDWSEATKC